MLYTMLALLYDLLFLGANPNFRVYAAADAILLAAIVYKWNLGDEHLAAMAARGIALVPTLTICPAAPLECAFNRAPESWR